MCIGDGYMVIYIDVLIFINTIINYLLICCVRCFLCLKSAQFKIIISALIGSLFSLAVFFDELNLIFSFILKLLCASVMCFIAFMKTDIYTYVKSILATFIFTIAFTSLVILFCQVLKPKNIAIVNDIFYVHINPLLLIFISFIFYLLFCILKKVLEHNAFDSLVNVRIVISDKEYIYKGKIDTGNSVTEPFSGAPVIITEQSVFGDYIIPKPRIIPFQVLNGNGYVLGVKPQKLYIDDKLISKDVYIGVYNGTINDNFKAIINSKILR